MSADSVPSSKTDIFQSKLIYCRHFRTYSRCTMFGWSDTIFRRRNVTRRRISNTVLQPRYWGSEADSLEVCRLQSVPITTKVVSSNPFHGDVYSVQWLTTGRWFFPCTPDSSFNKTDRHDITEILLKVALNTLHLKPEIKISTSSCHHI